LRYKNYFGDKGGVTVTGGEPLVQIDFVIELFTLFKAKGIHTCIDTSGVTYDVSDAEYIEKLDRLLELTDLVMLDIKHIDPQKHKDLTGHDNQGIINFAKHLDSKNVAIWIRHVIVEGYTDDDNDLLRLGEFIGSLKQVKALDVIPYHTMGASKYKEMGIKYRLEGLGALSKESAMIAKQKILEGIRKTRR
jgi:pyruvate formate lyase activating enzyme